MQSTAAPSSSWSTNRWQAPRTCRDAVEMHRVPLHYTPKDCVQAAESWLRSCKDPLKRSPETPLHHGSEPCPGRAAGSVSAPAGHLTPVLTTPDLVPGLGTVTTVRHVYVRHPDTGPDPLRTESEELRKGVNPFPQPGKFWYRHRIGIFRHVRRRSLSGQESVPGGRRRLILKLPTCPRRPRCARRRKGGNARSQQT